MSALKLISFSKICNRCNCEKPLSEFSKNSSSKDKLQYRCKECDNKYQANRRKENNVERREYDRQYQANKRKNFEYRLQMLINASKQRAKLKNREHSITVNDIKSIFPVNGCCPIFGMKLEFNNAGFRENSPSIDRIDSSKGYTKDNIQVISWKANRIKSYATVEELEIIVAYMKQGN